MDDELSITFAALADSTRRAILLRLADGEATVNDLAEPFPISLQAISRHLKVLERAGLITRGKEAQWRPCRLEPAPLETAAGWIEDSRRIWTDRFDRLGQHLANIQRTNIQRTTSTDKSNGLTGKEPKSNHNRKVPK